MVQDKELLFLEAELAGVATPACPPPSPRSAAASAFSVDEDPHGDGEGPWVPGCSQVKVTSCDDPRGKGVGRKKLITGVDEPVMRCAAVKG